MATETEWRAYVGDALNVNLYFACMGEATRRWQAEGRIPGVFPPEAWWELVYELYIETSDAHQQGVGGEALSWQAEIAGTSRGQRTQLIENEPQLHRTAQSLARKEKAADKKRRTLQRRADNHKSVPLWFQRELDQAQARKQSQLNLFSGTNHAQEKDHNGSSPTDGGAAPDLGNPDAGLGERGAGCPASEPAGCAAGEREESRHPTVST